VKPVLTARRENTTTRTPRSFRVSVISWVHFAVAWCVVVAMSGALAAAASDLRLIEAVKRQDAQAVRSLLKQHVDVNAPQGDGATALHWAAHLDDLQLTDLLIRAGARASAANDTGATPLHLACTNRSTAMVERLLAGGANPNAALLNGETVLMTCARAGDAGAVRALLMRGANANAVESSHDQTALMWAAAEGHPDAVEALVQGGADVRARSRAFTQTVTSEVTQRAGREELNYTVVRGGSTPLLFAARAGDERSTQALVSAGADVNDKLPDGTSALVLAAHSGHEATAITLLEKGADPNAAEIGYTALHAAVLRGRLGLVQALLAHGANPNAQITKGTPVRRNSEDFELPATLIGATPYLLAAKFVEVDLMRALAAGGADPRLPMKSGVTPLMAAAGLGANAQSDRRGLSVIDGGKLEDERRVVAAVTLALELGSDIDAGNQAGDTALHGAASLGYNTVIQVLVDRGASLTAKNKRGQTVLAALAGRRGEGRTTADRANDSPRQTTVDLLRKLGATE
jgi:ankyrin repeat protein